MPVLYAMLLASCRHTLSNKRTSPLAHATSFLHKEYEPEFFWWELVHRCAPGHYRLFLTMLYFRIAELR